MPLYTDDPACAIDLLSRAAGPNFTVLDPCASERDDPGAVVADSAPARAGGHAADHAPPRLLRAIFGAAAPIHVAPGQPAGWRHVLVRDNAPSSQFDALVQLVRAGVVLPDRVACLARTGAGFHGFRGRPWVTSPGNIHLSVHFAPQRPVAHFAAAFMSVAAVAVLDAVDGVGGLEGRARIKWVNDVLVDGAKIAGVLAFTQTRDDVVTAAVVGIGVNVETRPAVARSPFVPAAGALRDFASGATAASAPLVLERLLRALDARYRELLEHGPAPLLERYRARCAVLGRDVTIVEPEEHAGAGTPRVLAAGRVAAIGDDLELYLHDRAEPVTSGRLRFDTPADEPAGHASRNG